MYRLTQKTVTFEKPNKNWRNPTKNNYWQKLNHYYLPFKSWSMITKMARLSVAQGPFSAVLPTVHGCHYAFQKFPFFLCHPVLMHSVETWPTDLQKQAMLLEILLQNLLSYAVVISQKVLRKSEWSIHIVKYVSICKEVHVKSGMLEPDWPQHDHPTAYVIAQRYSSNTFISLFLHYHKEKFDALFKKFL